MGASLGKEFARGLQQGIVVPRTVPATDAARCHERTDRHLRRGCRHFLARLAVSA
jgi:hypothetical protein